MRYQIIIVMMLIKNTRERGSGRVGGGDTNVRPLFLSVVSYSVHDY